MLTDYEKEHVKKKILELQKTLSDMGFASEIEIRASDMSGYTQYDVTVDNGFWRSSTQVCNPDWGASHEHIDTPRMDYDEWQPSALDC